VDKADTSYTEALVSVVLGQVQQGDRLLDICCGYGRLALPLLQRGFRVTGVDFSGVLLRRGRELALKAGIASNPFVQGRLQELPVAGGGFKLCFCVWASFNFLISRSDQMIALDEMHRILIPGGRALIECPLHLSAAPVQIVQAGEGSYEYCSLTLDEIRALAARSPFAKHRIFTEDIAGRPRALALLEKSS